jgi:hypothetical protein
MVLWIEEQKIYSPGGCQEIAFLSTFSHNSPRPTFLKGRSTISALIEISQKWFDETENTARGRKGIHVIFKEYHRILLSKLASMNLTKSFGLCIRDFLSMRSQQVKLLQMLSPSSPCPAGVPQSSVISP